MQFAAKIYIYIAFKEIHHHLKVLSEPNICMIACKLYKMRDINLTKLSKYDEFRLKNIDKRDSNFRLNDIILSLFLG